MIEFIIGAVFLYILFIVIFVVVGIIARLIPEKPHKQESPKKNRHAKATKWGDLPYAEDYREFKEINSKDGE
ncbi:MAG: hypothetical protein Q8P26_01945 [Candidatus Levybacteria bacterium]|nr:hypothetical protein [Candidatus Levybacteria bacterium]